MTKLLPPLPAQPAPAGDWGAPNGDLVPPPEGLASEWTKQDAQPRADSGVVSEPQEPSDELQPPSVSATGVWELFEGIKMAQADEAAAAASETREATAVVGEPATELLPPPVDTVNFWTNRKAEARSDDAAVEDKESPAEPATDLVPPPVGEADVSAWTKQETAAASDAAPAKASAPAAGRADDVPEPASDSYMPDTPSSGEAHADDFLSLGAAPPPSDAAVEFIKEHSDSYLPGAGELKALSEGPVVDDFLAIGEPPKEDAETTVPRKDIAPEELAKEEEAVKDTKTDSKEDGKDSYMPQTDSKEDARDSYMPQTDSKTDSKEDARDSYTPDEASSSSSREDADDIGLVAPAKEQPSAEKATDGVGAEVHEHSHEHADDEVHATTPATEDADDDVDGDGAKASGSGDLRKKRHICKVCGGGGGGFGGGLPSVSIVINKQPA
ncbi:hypothetical protein ONE63_007548 [Megalurothrips usitatus]|uniref:Uncharacterized protein n=1 Tax=Megalurothrips usitatus TaxID=439358 RepID=A0AAV7XP48_9NEOP|nr:hypothetical protein ONE63_007548 [Megalurothrips usitatus]